MTLSRWGIHLFQAPLHRGIQGASYYLERPYAPLIIFPPPDNSISKPKDFEFMESKGGLSFQLQLYPDRPNQIQRGFYERFGCPLVAPWTEELFEELVHEDYTFRYARRGHDFYDHHVLWTKVNETDGVYIIKNDAHFCFFGAPWILDRGVIRHAPTGKAYEKLDLQYRQGASKRRPVFGLFQFFRGLNWCEISDMIS